MQVGSRRCICNPVSGSGDHAESVSRLLRGRGFEVEHTDGPGDAISLAREAAADGVTELAVAGGDGTVNEVLRGLDATDHLDEVTLSVIPTGTANLLARMVGIHSVEQAVDLADTGPTRRIDLGMADGEPFAVSCIAGFPADASVATSSDLKERFGTFAFILTALQEAVEFDGLGIHLEASGHEGVETWDGEALCLLVGNARRFVGEGGPADVEDGLFHVAVVERMPAGNLVAEAISHRLLGRQTEGITHMRASELTVTGQTGPITFSRDGEVSEHEQLTISMRPGALALRVGPEYDPHPPGT